MRDVLAHALNTKLPRLVRGFFHGAGELEHHPAKLVTATPSQTFRQRMTDRLTEDHNQEGSEMNKIAKSAMLVCLASLGLGLAACDSKQENAAEDQADAVRDQADAQADQIEATADAKDPVVDGVDSAAENAQEDAAAAVRNQGEAKADAMEDQADKADKTPG